MQSESEQDYSVGVRLYGRGSLYPKYLKRLLDLTVSVVSILALSPVLLVVGLLVWVKLGWPVIFRQSRPGKNEKVFTLYKFRTMTDARDEDGKLLPDSIRLTKFGRLLRSTSLDELPELFSVMKGDMSLVGPRPLALQYLPFYTPEERRRHNVRPGLSGLAQINGRNSLLWEERFRCDIEYVNSISFTLDLMIILKTLIKVFQRSDIGERGIDSPPDFDIYRQNQQRI